MKTNTQTKKKKVVANEGKEPKGKQTSPLQFKDNRPNTIQLKKFQAMMGNSPPEHEVIQKKGKGSHGKTKKLNVQGTYTVGGVATPFNDRDEKISIVKGHGGYTDEDALAEAWVRKAYRLDTTAVVTITKYNFFTAK